MLKKAKEELEKIIDEASMSHEPVHIVSKKNKAVLVPDEDWEAIQETLYLLSVPGMREKIVDGMKTPIDQCSEVLTWISGK